MKKFITLIMVLALSVCLCACGGSGSAKYSITCNDGSVEEKTIIELEDETENEVKFDELYRGAHISGKGKILGMEKQDDNLDLVDIQVDEITTELIGVPAEYAAKYDIGDEIEVRGTVSSHLRQFLKIHADASFYK